MTSQAFGLDLPAREFYSPREIEALSGLSHATIYRLIGRGELAAKKLGTKTLISAASYRALMAELPPAGRTRQDKTAKDQTRKE
jgi:excisionase family DNA binding protein